MNTEYKFGRAEEHHNFRYQHFEAVLDGEDDLPGLEPLACLAKGRTPHGRPVLWLGSAGASTPLHRDSYGVTRVRILRTFYFRFLSTAL